MSTTTALGTHPCLGCSVPVLYTAANHALCAICRSASYVTFCRANRHLDPSEWQRRLNEFHMDIAGRAALAQAERMVGAAS